MVSKCVPLSSSLVLLAFFSPCCLFCNKKIQCGPICYNSSTSRHLCAKIDCLLCLDVIILQCRHLRDPSFCLFSILCIKHAVTNFIVNPFINIISKTIIKCLYDGSKLLSKVLTTFSFLNGTSKQQINSQVP